MHRLVDILAVAILLAVEGIVIGLAVVSAVSS